MTCPCGSEQSFATCCEPYLAGTARPPTAEALMRSRYVAFTKGDIGYLGRTHAPKTRAEFDPAATKKWADEARFTDLKILRTEKGGESDKEGMVEFVASFTQDGETVEHHEVSIFRKDAEGRWFFVSGEGHRHSGEGHHHHHHPHHATVRPQPIVRAGPKVGRNDPCPCNSGKKWKKCCGA